MKKLFESLWVIPLFIMATTVLAGEITKPSGSSQAPVVKKGDDKTTGHGSIAFLQASKAKKHLFLFVYEGKDEKTIAAQKILESTMSKMTNRAQWVAVDRKDPAEKDLIDKYQLNTAPMPMVLVLAPNGVITGGFRGDGLTEKQLQEAIAGPGLQKCLKALQERKLVLLCVQNKATKSNDAAMQGVNDFKADTRYAQSTEIVKIDPADGGEGKFLSQLQIDPQAAEAVTAFLAPPRVALGVYTGATSKDAFVKALTDATVPSCGPGGCGPSGCGPQ